MEARRDDVNRYYFISACLLLWAGSADRKICKRICPPLPPNVIDGEMPTGPTRHNFLLTPFVNWRASRIQDPVAKLRFLKDASDFRLHLHDLIRLNGPIPRRVVFIAVAVLLFPRHTVSDANSIYTEQLAALNIGMSEKFANVWLVDRNPGYLAYSNGLRIETRYQMEPEEKRQELFRRFHKESLEPEAIDGPQGIVYHTTESHILPFEQDQSHKIQLLGENLIYYVRGKRAYHYVIDRFGRVYSVVPENEEANHAGHSVWANGQWVYVNLNQSFLGISFEAQTRDEDGQPTVSAAQIHAGRVLTDMLRGKYKIPSTNCVTHAQVSVNPQNMLIGDHTDWAGNFPFMEMGLRDNYEIPNAGVYAFGLEYDHTYMKSTGVRLWKGLALAEEQLRQDAVSHGLPVTTYRKIRQNKLKEMLEALRKKDATEEIN
jgi:hypothetical protein